MAKKQRVSVVGTVLTVEYPTIGKVFKVDFATYPEEIQPIALAHGFKQKFGDAKSGGTPAEKFAEVQLIHASLLAGEWERTTGPVDLTPIICEAVARIMKAKLPAVMKIAEAHPDRVETWKTQPRVRAEILKIRAERAAEAAEADDEEIIIDLK